MENNLKDIQGIKIRQQYFTIPVFIHYVMMLFVPYCILIFSMRFGIFNMQEWLSSVWISVWVCFCFSLPWVILKFLNTVYFGKVICVLTENGIYYKDGFIEWNRISKIEYIIDLPPRHRHDPKQRCRAVLYIENKTIVLLHAPRRILRSVKKLHPKTKTMLANESKWLIAAFVLCLIVVALIIAFYK